MIKAVLFDLDGTLVDTAPDLAAALNAVRIAQGLMPMDYATIRPEVSNGASALIQLGFNLEIGHPDFEPLRQQLLDYYQKHICDQSSLFSGMDDLLDALESGCYAWGVVTNKPAFLTQPLMSALGLAQRAKTIVSGDTAAHRKPHPAPMLYAARELGLTPEECLYLGDAARDIEAGKLAGMKTAAALFGYIGAQDQPADWQADYMIAHPMDLLALLL